MTEFRISRGLHEGGIPRKLHYAVRQYGKCLPEREKTPGYKVSIVTNAAAWDTALQSMIHDFRASLDMESSLHNIGEYPFSGGCIGCLSCTASGKCIHKDGFDEYLRTQIQNADSIVYAFRIENHYTASSMKCYDDRQFCNGHRAVTAGRPAAYIIAGDLRDERNLQDLIEARASVGGNFLAAIAADEGEDTAKAIKNAAESLSYAIRNGIEEPKTFFGTGGSRIFRDLIYEMRGLMKADHRFYKSRGLYNDFPQKHKARILAMKLVGILASLPGAKKNGMMAKGMLEPYRKVVASIGGNEQE